MTAKKIISLTAAATMVVTALGVAAPAAARDRDYRGDYAREYRGDYGRDYRYGQRDVRSRDYRNYRDYDYRRAGYAYDNRTRCRNDGAAGTIIGAIAGGLIGNEVAGRGDKTAGVIIGGAVGAIAGRAIDKGDSRC